MKVVNVENFEQFKELVDGSAFTWLGMTSGEDNLKAIESFFKEEGNVMDPNQEMEIHIWTGKQGNEWMGLIKDPYPEDLTCISLPLDQFNNIGKLAMLKLQVGARWLDDIYDNNLRHEKGE